MKRYLTEAINDVLGKKIILLMGPRQVGKTTLVKSLQRDFAYYNYDISKDLKVFKEQRWDTDKSLLIFDEIHKMKKWKLWLKGLYDDEILKKQKVIVTGSARLDIAKKMGDSLAGRFFSYRLNPLDLKELKNVSTPESNYKKLINYGGFPEPFLEASEKFYTQWKRSHMQTILRQDLISLENIRDIDGIEVLIELLKSRVGSLISFNSLSEDLGRDDKTIKKWIGYLENLYIVFRVSPYSKNITRGIKKSGKYYFYDIAQVEGDEAMKLENLVALSLKKEVEYQEDVNGIEGKIYFVQTTDKKEIDFLVMQKKRAPSLIEVKMSDSEPSSNFLNIGKYFGECQKIQLVKNLDRQFQTKTGVQVCHALSYLTDLNLK